MDALQLKQLIKYLIIGGTSNAIGYATYLALTHFGLPAKIAMTLLYLTAATLSFWGNKKITFSYEGAISGAGTRFVIAHSIGYLINLAIIILLVDRLGYDHRIVQATAIVTVAIYLFIAMKLFVFRSDK